MSSIETKDIVSRLACFPARKLRKIVARWNKYYCLAAKVCSSFHLIFFKPLFLATSPLLRKNFIRLKLVTHFYKSRLKCHRFQDGIKNTTLHSPLDCFAYRLFCNVQWQTHSIFRCKKNQQSILLKRKIILKLRKSHFLYLL